MKLVPTPNANSAFTSFTLYQSTKYLKLSNKRIKICVQKLNFPIKDEDNSSNPIDVSRRRHSNIHTLLEQSLFCPLLHCNNNNNNKNIKKEQHKATPKKKQTKDINNDGPASHCFFTSEETRNWKVVRMNFTYIHACMMYTSYVSLFGI